MNGGDENQESRIKNHGRAASWLIWIGALFVVSVAPLQNEFDRLWRSGNFNPYPGKVLISYAGTYDFYFYDLAGHSLPLLAFVLPSLLFTFVAAGPRAHRVLLVAFLPLSALACVLARNTAPAIPILILQGIDIPPWLASLLPAAGAVGIVAAYVIGVPSASLAPVARRLLAADVLWIILLQWNTTNFAVRYFPGWVGAAGAAMILLGETLARPAPVILDS